MANLRVDKITSTETFETTGSVQFDGSTSNIRAGWVDDYNYLHNGTEDWTVECWIYRNATNNRQTIWSTGGNSSVHGMTMRIESGALGGSNGDAIGVQLSKSTDGTWLFWGSGDTTLDKNKWYHVAVVFRSSNKSLEIYVDGKLTNGKGDLGNPSVVGGFGSYSASNAYSGLILGMEPLGSSLKFNGFLSNFRIIQGTAIYTENFKVPMKELEVISGTTLLCCQSSYSPAAAKISPFILQSDSGVNDGTIWSDAQDVSNGSRLRHTDFGDSSIMDAAKVFDARDDTDAETPNGTSTSLIFDFENILGKKIPVSSSIKIKIGGSDGRTLKVNGTTIATNAGPTESVITNQSTLNKVEVVAESSSRSGRLAYIKVDDVSLTLPILPFGKTLPSELSPGLLTDKVVDGGSSAITGSVEFDGNDDYLQVTPNSDLSFTGDFTVEYWVYMSKSETHMRQIGSNNYYTAGKNGNWYFGIHNESSPNVYFFTYDGQSNAEFAGASFTSSLNSWYHLAAARVGNTLTIYVNGVKLISATISKDIIDGSVGGIQIGKLPSYGYHNGFISNLRIVNGTALYTHDFIPPTRELKKVPGTVLLCCQDPDNPLTEATGKTITGYGDLHEATDVEMLTNGSFAGGYSTEWEAKNSGSLSHANGKLTVTSTQNYSGVRVKSAYLPSLIRGRKYAMTIDLESITNPIRFGVVSGGTKDNVSTAGRHTLHFTGQTSTSEIFIEKPDGPNSTFVLKSVSIRELNTPNGASNFTPQVGDDRKVTFEGVTKINSDAYFYLPTGDTASRETTGTYNAGTRGVMMGGIIAGGSTKNATIDYWTMASTGDAIDFGDCTAASGQGAGVASRVRGVNPGGFTRSTTNFDYVTIMSTGNALDFGDLPFTHNVSSDGGFSSETRGVFHQGLSTGPTTFYNIIDYITIASTGNALDFGDTTITKLHCAGVGSPTRGVWAGGYNPNANNVMDYVTIASTGNAQDFGDLIASKYRPGGCSSAIRGLFFGGGGAPSLTNTISYITIASTGNAQDFGDLVQAQEFPSGTSSSTRGVKVGGSGPSPGPYSPIGTIEYFEIATTGNAQTFGDLFVTRARGGTFSNGHGGLG